MPVVAQIHDYPAVDTPNIFTNTNTFQGNTYFPNLATGVCLTIDPITFQLDTMNCSGGGGVNIPGLVVTGSGTGQNVSFTGGITLGNQLLLPADPTSALGGATKQYVDAERTRATGAESTLTTNLGNEVTRAIGAESTLTTNLAATNTTATNAQSTANTANSNASSALGTANAAQATANAALPAAGALNALINGASSTGTGTSNNLALAGNESLFGNLAFGNQACSGSVLTGTACGVGLQLSNITISQLPPASFFTGADPIYWVTDSADGSCINGGGIYDVGCYSDGVSWHALATLGGVAPNNPNTTIAVTASEVTYSNDNTVASIVPGGTGAIPTFKILGNCATGYNGSAYTPTNHPVGEAWCAGDQTSGVASGGATKYLVAVTKTGIGLTTSTNFEQGNGAGGSNSPASTTANHFGTGSDPYHSFCSGDPTATAPTNINGITLPGCLANSSAFLNQTSTSGYGQPSVLFPAQFTQASSTVDNVLYMVWDGWVNIPTSTLTRLEFDDNQQNSQGQYYGFGFSYNVSATRFEFLPQANHFIGHGTCSGTWCQVVLKLISGTTAMTGCADGASTCTLIIGHTYHIRKYEHRAPNTVACSSSTTSLTYDEFDIADVTAGQNQLSRYILTDPANANKAPQGWCVSQQWSIGYGPQFQLYQNSTSTTVSVQMDSVSLVGYSVVAGTGGSGTGFSMQQTDLGQYNFDTSSNLGLNSDSSSTTYSAIGTAPTSVTSNTQSGAGAMSYSVPGNYIKTTFDGPKNTLYGRFYYNPLALSTDGAFASRIFALFGASGSLFHIYANDNSKTLVVYNDVTSGTLCNLTTVAVAVQGQGAWNYIDFVWNMGTSNSTGSFTFLVNGVAPSDTNCSQSSFNTGYTGSQTGATYAELGYITDTGSSQNWIWAFDNLAFNDNAEPNYGGFIGPVTPGSSPTQTYDPYGSATSVQNTILGFSGQVTSASGTTVSHSFSTGYTGTPLCVASPKSNSGAYYFSALSSSAFTITYATSGVQTFNVYCPGAGGQF